MIERIVNKDLGMSKRVIQEKLVLTIDAAKKRHKRARKLHLRLRKEDSDKVLIFSDEKLFVANTLYWYQSLLDGRAHSLDTSTVGPVQFDPTLSNPALSGPAQCSYKHDSRTTI